MEINERWLMDTVGWPVFKEGRQLYRGGAVAAVEWDAKSGLLRGTLVSGRTPRVAGMKILARTDVENLCRCPQSQREGAICAHSVAVAFAWIEEGDIQAKPETEQPASSAPSGTRDNSRQSQTAAALPALTQVLGVQVEADFIKIWEKGKLPLRLSLIDPNADPASMVDLTPDILAACARFSAWLGRNGIDAASPPPFVVLDARQAMEFFAAVASYPWLQLGEDGPGMTVDSTPIRPPLTLTLSEQGEVDENGEPWVQFSLHLDTATGSPSRLLTTNGEEANSGGSLGYLFDATYSTLTPLPRGGELLNELLADDADAEVWRPMRWIVEHLDELNDQFHVDTEALDTPIRLVTATPKFELSLEGSLNALTARLLASYSRADKDGGETALRLPATGNVDAPGSDDEEGDTFPLCDPWQTGLYWQRNLASEKRAVERLEEAGFRSADDHGRWVLQGRDAVLAFFGSELSAWRESGCEVILGERLRHVTRGLERVAPQLENFDESSSGESWFECEFGFATSSGATLKDSEIRQLLASGRREVALSQNSSSREDSGAMPSQGDGVGVIDTQAVEEWQETLHDLNAEQIRPGRYRIQRHHRDYLRATLGESVSREKDSQIPVDQLLADLSDTLLDYQVTGVSWLYQRLLTGGLGGAVLADEMGLGKTLQTLAALRALRNSGEADFVDRPALVVAPTSLLANWQAEAERFVPELETLIYHGSQRSEQRKQNAFTKCDLIITSYGVLSRDVDEFERESVEFSLVALDEASFVRNPKTKAAKAVRKLNCAARLALTGTPVENSVRDLWAIMDFALPGCLGSQEEFRQRYELPLAGNSPPTKLMTRLNRRVAPHLLRRTKRAVVKELPDKIEQVRFCEMTATQRTLYAQMVDASRKSVSDALSKSSGGSSGQARMIALTALLRLRQICCDPRLLGTDSDEKTASAEDSAKMELLRETIREARDGGHRVLIFSQFTAMLTLIAEQLDGDGCKYARLDGSNSTTERARAVKLFQSDDSIPAFLISLKAGGYGLNLTAADTVIHFDPWWNPAVEAQATDRAHRIGQERPVTSLKLICRGTVEEKILRLQQRKTATFGGTIEDDAPLMNGLSEEEVREVLDL